MIKLLEIGKKYPFDLPHQEGAAVNFLTTDSNILVIAINNLTATELFALKKGKIKAGFLYENGDLLFLFTFFDKKGAVFTLDAPFDIREVDKEIRALHSITDKEQRLAIEIHVIDNGIVKALRLITIPNKLTVEFLSAVQEQLATTAKNSAMQKWMQHSPGYLTKKVKMHELGK